MKKDIKLRAFEKNIVYFARQYIKDVERLGELASIEHLEFAIKLLDDEIKKREIAEGGGE